MNQTERLHAVFDRTPLDHLPWVPDLTYWRRACDTRGVLPPEYGGGHDGYRRLHEACDTCAYYGIGDTSAFIKEEGIKRSSHEDGDMLIERIECDGHTLEQHSRWLPESWCRARTKYYVADVSDLAVVREIFRRRTYAPNPNVNQQAAAFEGIGVPITAMPRSPFPALFADWIGVEATVYMVIDEPDEIEQTLRVIDQTNDGFFTFLPNSNARICHFCDNLTADTMGGFWDLYCAEYYARRVAQIHAAGKACVTHLDGATRGLIPKLVASGLDGIESLPPKPVGDITMDEMVTLMGDSDTVFWGGLPGAMFAPPFEWRDLRTMIDGLFRLHRNGQRVVIASADQVPPHASLDTIKQVTKYVEELGV